jgi:hypothetical protein
MGRLGASAERYRNCPACARESGAGRLSQRDSQGNGNCLNIFWIKKLIDVEFNPGNHVQAARQKAQKERRAFARRGIPCYPMPAVVYLIRRMQKDSPE